MTLHYHDYCSITCPSKFPFGRLRKIVERGTSPAVLVAEYRYNGLNQRITAHFDTDADGDVDGSDVVSHFAYDNRWRIVARFEDTNTHPTEQFVFHHAGLASAGSGSYIDAVILRDRDTNANGTLDQRVYHLQNWRHDVSLMLTHAGSMVQWVKYSAYGVPFGLPAGDTDSDGDFDSADTAAMSGSYDPRKDANLDGSVDFNDVLSALAVNGGTVGLGRGRLSADAVGNRRGYAGYEFDATFAGAGRNLYHVRHRVYDADLGRWTRRDPLGYVDGMGLYEYVNARPVMAVDPTGQALHVVLCCASCAGLAILDGVRDILNGACAGSQSIKDLAVCIISKLVPRFDILMCMIEALTGPGSWRTKLRNAADCFTGNAWDIVIDAAKTAACVCCVISAGPGAIRTLLRHVPRLPQSPIPAMPMGGSSQTGFQVPDGLYEIPGRA